MNSSWQLPLPLEGDEPVNIVVCYHSAHWIPLTCLIVKNEALENWEVFD
jgi:hypothetical protein